MIQQHDYNHSLLKLYSTCPECPEHIKLFTFSWELRCLLFILWRLVFLSRNLTISFYIFPTLVSYRYSGAMLTIRRLYLLAFIFLYWGYFCMPGELRWHFIVDQHKSCCASLLTVHFTFLFMWACWWRDSMILSHPCELFFVTASIIYCNNKI